MNTELDPYSLSKDNGVSVHIDVGTLMKLQNVLRVNPEDYGTNPESAYPHRIFAARILLGLMNDEESAVIKDDNVSED
jgi:hypothetical protein